MMKNRWAATTPLHFKEIKSNSKRVPNIRCYVNNYGWSRLKFPVAINKINEFEKNNVNVLL